MKFNYSVRFVKFWFLLKYYWIEMKKKVIESD